MSVLQIVWNITESMNMAHLNKLLGSNVSKLVDKNIIWMHRSMSKMYFSISPYVTFLPCLVFNVAKDVREYSSQLVLSLVFCTKQNNTLHKPLSSHIIYVKWVHCTCIVTRGWIYCEKLSEPEGNSDGWNQRNFSKEFLGWALTLLFLWNF